MDELKNSEEEFDKGRWPILFECSGELFRQMVELNQAIEALKDKENGEELND